MQKDEHKLIFLCGKREYEEGCYAWARYLRSWRTMSMVDQTFEKCDDILHRQVYLGQGRQEGLLVYVEVAVSI